MLILAVVLVFYQAFVKPSDKAIAEAKSKAAFLLKITDRTSLKMVGEAGMAETIDNNNHCYTYAFQGEADFQTVKTVAASLLADAGYKLEQMVTIDSESTYQVKRKASDGWATRLQVLRDTALVKVAKNVIDNPVTTTTQPGQILVSGQVCKE